MKFEYIFSIGGCSQKLTRSLPEARKPPESSRKGPGSFPEKPQELHRNVPESFQEPPRSFPNSSQKPLTTLNSNF